MTRLSPALGFAFFYSTAFLALGLYLPFWPLWLTDTGLSAQQVGWLLALSAWVKIFSVPAVTLVADRSGRPRLVLGVLSLIGALCFGLFPLATHLWLIVLLQGTAAFAFFSLLPLGESQAMQAASNRRMDYGRVRLWGSIAFIVGAYGIGELLSRYGVHLLIWGLVATLAATAWACSALPKTDPVADRSHLLADARRMLSDRPYLSVLLVGGLLQASHGAYYGFSALHWNAAGLSKGAIGALWAEGVVAEIIFFAWGSAILSRLGAPGLLALAACAGLIRWSVLASTTALPALIAVQGLHALTFGAAHLGILTMITARAPAGLKASALGLFAATGGGLAMGLSVLLSGWLYESAPWQAFGAMTILSLLALGSTVLFFRKRQDFL